MTRHPTPLVGRDAELADLLALVESAAHGEPAAIVVAGDAGVGKSRLIAELGEHLAAAGTQVLLGHCVNLPDGGLPYLPFVDAFRQLDTETWRRLEPHLRGGAAQPLGPLQLYEAVVQMLFEMAEQQPVCLVVEDLHWSDRPTKDLLRFLLGRLENERLAVVLTYRSDDLHRRHPLRPFLADAARMPSVRRLALDPLPPAAIATLVTADGPVEASVLDDIVARADGNAFFAEELREAQRTCQGVRALPDALLDVLVARLEQLDPGAARVVAVAAVAGRRVGHDVLAAVTGLADDALDEALREAVARHVLVPDGLAVSYEFRHALLQEAAYADLLPGERVRLHREYARVLAARLADSPAVAAELAYHAELSHDPLLALSASVQAASHAGSVHAPSEAQRHLERALSFWSSVPDAAALAGAGEVELHVRAAEAAAASGDALRAVALLQEARRKVSGDAAGDRSRADGPASRPPSADDALAALVHARLAMAHYQVGDDVRALATSARAVELAATLDASPVRAEVHSMRAYALFVEDDIEAAAVEAKQALADAVASGSPAIQAEALMTLSRIAERAADPDTAATHLTSALELARRSGDVAAELRALHNLAMSRYDAGDLPATLEWTRRARQRASAAGWSWSAYAREARGIGVIARYVSGDWNTSLDDSAAGAAMAPAIGRPLLDAYGLHVAVGRGLPDVAERLGRLRAAHHPDPHEDALIVMLTGGCEIDHLTWQGQPAAAVAEYVAAVDYPTPLWGAHYLARIWLGALALAALGEQARAARLREDAAAADLAVAQGESIIEDARATAKLGVPRGGRLGAEGVAWLARAEAEWSRLLDERDDGVWRVAVAAFDYGYTYEVARCRWRLAEVLLDRAAATGGDGASGAPGSGGDSAHDAGDEAAELLRSAYADAQSLGAAPLAEAVAALARRARISGVGRPVTVSLLTPREQEVLALLARGRTNRQLGKELFISEKTASVHVSNILAKLGAGTRGEAVAIAQRRGLV